MKRGPVVLVLLFCLWLAAAPLVRADEAETPVPAQAPVASQPLEPTEILRRLSKVRGLDIKENVPIQYASREEVSTAVAQSDARPASRDALVRLEALLRLLDLLPEDSDLTSSAAQVIGEQLGGAYSLTQKSMIIVPFGDDQSGLDEILLAHEYTHALQDQNFRLERKFRRVAGDSEASLALRSLVEGDASFASAAYLAATKSQEELKRLSTQAEGVVTPQLNSAPGILQGSFLFPYTQGMRFVASLYASGGWDAVNKAYDTLPSSAEHILHPDRYLAGDAPRLVGITDVSRSMSEWTLEESGVFGELTFLYYLSTGLEPDDAAIAAEGWGGDRYLLLRHKFTGKYALAVLSIWDTEKDAREYMAGVDEVMYWRDGAEMTVDTAAKIRWTSPRRAWYVARSGNSVLQVIAPDDVVVKSIARRIAPFRP